MTTCTNESIVPHRPVGDGFSVSYTVQTGDVGVRLGVARLRWMPLEQAHRIARRCTRSLVVCNRRDLDGLASLMTRLPDHGRVFPTREAAHRFALERGYLRDYVTDPQLRADRKTKNLRVRRLCECGTLHWSKASLTGKWGRLCGDCIRWEI